MSSYSVKYDHALRRGWYITNDNNPMLHLFDDGVERTGVVSEDASGFWPTEGEAKTFLKGRK